jgi:hypothetical protein
MTTPAAANLYLAQHLLECEGRQWAVVNPNGVDPATLPVIYGFNNGGGDNWYEALLITEDGHWIGSHLCSHEGYMPNDLGILTGSRSDRHVTFAAYYPDGYRMEFVGYDEFKTHERIKAACALADSNPHNKKKA